ncbi:hypothetical protein Tco_0624958 [Tanacetum coccineum]|uniref:Uncharacterized protein n=1 Tax=Tanacetum coccineum TaxID=301880 RepID=A0ABQ4WFE5_9ASTR
MLATRGSGKVTTMEARANKTKGIRCLEHTLLGQSTRRHMLDLYLCATSASFTIMDHALWKEEKRLEDVPTIRDFPEVFPEDLQGLPTTRQVEISDQSGTWCCICGAGALLINAVRNEKVVRATARNFRQSLFMA